MITYVFTMKKTILAALLLSCSAAFAVDSYFLDLETNSNQNGITYTAPSGESPMGTFSGGEGSLYSTQTNNSSKVTVAFTLNLTQAIKESTSDNFTSIGLVTAGKVGLRLTAGGSIVGDNNGANYGGDASVGGPYTISLQNLLTNDTVYTLVPGGDSYITLTMTVIGASSTGTAGFGVQLYDSTGANLLHMPKLATSSNKSFDVLANTDYISAVAIHPDRVVATDTNTPGQLATSLQSKLVPEPATATLSLLAMAGLAARRRRK